VGVRLGRRAVTSVIGLPGEACPRQDARV